MRKIIGDGTNPIAGVGYNLNSVILRRTDGKDRNENKSYSGFVKMGQRVYFTDAQIDFMWDYLEWFFEKSKSS